VVQVTRKLRDLSPLYEMAKRKTPPQSTEWKHA
jgi:hypothetical protein